MTTYNIKDTVWIHLGEHSLVEGKIEHMFTLSHGQQLYVIEIPTHIDPVYEVREWETMSPDAIGPINMFRQLKTEHRYLKKLGVKSTKELVEVLEEDEPTTDQINEALHRTEQSTKHSAMSPKPATKARRRSYKKPKA